MKATTPDSLISTKHLSLSLPYILTCSSPAIYLFYQVTPGSGIKYFIWIFGVPVLFSLSLFSFMPRKPAYC